jgi:hypothetical protein
VARVHGPRATGAYSQVRCAGASAMPSDAGTAAVHCKAERQADGLYVVEFLPLVRGEFVINVTVHAGPYGQRKLGNLPGADCSRLADGITPGGRVACGIRIVFIHPFRRSNILTTRYVTLRPRAQ